MTWQAIISEDEITEEMSTAADALLEAARGCAEVATSVATDDNDAVRQVLTIYICDHSDLVLGVALKDGEVIWMEHIPDDVGSLTALEAHG